MKAGRQEETEPTHACVPGAPLIMSKTCDSSSPCTATPSTESSRSPCFNLPSTCAGPPGIKLLINMRRVALCCSSSSPMLALLSPPEAMVLLNAWGPLTALEGRARVDPSSSGDR